MKRYIISALLLLVILFQVFAYSGLHAQDAPTIPDVEPNLTKIADDMKFNNGLQFVQLKRYKKARQEFEEYLEIYYNGIHRHEAYRHLADMAFFRFNYQKAAQLYTQLYQEYSTDDAGIRAYYKAGICFNKMGFEKKARKIFTAITQNHSQSPTAHQAQIQLDLLGILSSN